MKHANTIFRRSCFFAACLLLLPGALHASEPKTVSQFLRDGTFSVQLRSYFMDRNFYSNPGSVEQSYATGGSLGYKTPQFHGFGLGGVGYTSQRFFGSPLGSDGAGLLAPGQAGYTSLGQAYLQFTRPTLQLTVFRQALNSPFLNLHDVRMTPITFEAYTAVFTPAENLALTVSQVTGMKNWTDTDFKSMTRSAGYAQDNPLTMAGAVYTMPQGHKLQLWTYQAYNYVNISYFQSDFMWKPGQWRYVAGAQAITQVDTGSAIGGSRHGAEVGIKGGFGRGPWNTVAALTQAMPGHSLSNPWGGYPGYTSIMEEDCDLSGERAWLLHFDYDFAAVGMRGLRGRVDYTQAFDPNSELDSPRQRESNLTLDYAFAGVFKGLSVMTRLANVSNSQSDDGSSYSDFRFILNYSFQ